jgi:hypothetical protein
LREFLYKLQLVRGDIFQNAAIEQEQAEVAEHFAYLQNLTAKGAIIVVG